MNQTQTPSRKAEGCTWGVEIECLLPDDQIRGLPIRIGDYHQGHPLPAPFPQVAKPEGPPWRSPSDLASWTAERDGSLGTRRAGYTPVEIVSPILQGRAGIEQVKQVAQTLKDIGAAVNATCGFHCHIGAERVAGPRPGEVAEWVAKLLYQTAMHETALYASTGTHRRENGHFSRSVKDQKADADRIRKASTPHRKREELSWAANRGRYHTLNLTNLFTPKATVEFRWGAGTVEWQKMVGHICTCLALAERATETTRMDWEGLASERTYHVNGKGLRELNRLFYLTGWTMGRRDVGKPEVEMAGWIADTADLAPVKRELRRLARKYDRAAM